MVEKKNVKLMPTSWLLFALVAMAVLRFAFPVMRILPGLWGLAGIIPLALGVAMNLAADRAFHKAGTTVKPFEESSALLATGVFRVTRNPMYLGFVLILAGAAALLGALTPWLVVPAFAVLLDRMYITVEERMLAAKFGPAWQEYSHRTRRWV
jgi:protein-S-isoprenylcysteine O-methyltransferase Ste14